MEPSLPSSATRAGAFPVKSYKPRYDKWPYSTTDFRRRDESDDRIFYRQARLVTHIDEAAIARLTQYFDEALPKTGRILDMCTSWKSFYPVPVEQAVEQGELEVFGAGLNAEEMRLNGVFRDEEHWKVLDLNKPPHDVGAGWGEDLTFDAVTCVVSIDYLIEPLEVCKNVLKAMNEGGRMHLIVSNRCFPDKIIRRWMILSERERLELVGGEYLLHHFPLCIAITALSADYLHFSGWTDVEIVDVCARDQNGRRLTDDQGRVLVDSAGRLPSHLDPLWVVRGTKSASSSSRR